MVDYNRQTVCKREEYIDGSTLKDVLDNVLDLIKRYGERAEVSYTINNLMDDYQYLYVFSSRSETDEEMNSRIKTEEYAKKKREERDKEEYERLKKKFEG